MTYSEGLTNHQCVCLSALAVTIIAAITLYRFSTQHRRESFFVRGNNSSSNGGMLDLTSRGRKLQTPTDYLALNEGRTDRSLLNRGQLANYMNLAYPPGDTRFISSQGQQCAVSDSNNCPSDLYWKCSNRKWSKDAIGEALALSAVGSYYVPSSVEDENMHKIVSLAHDPVTQACRVAGSVTEWNPSGVAPAGSPVGVTAHGTVAVSDGNGGVTDTGQSAD